MKRLLSAVTALAIVTSAGLAMAAAASGTIKSIDTTTRMIVLNDGTKYQADKSVDLSKLKVGEKVTLTFEVKNGENILSAVKM